MTTLPNLITQLILAEEPGDRGGDTVNAGAKTMGGLSVVDMVHTASLNSSSSISSNASSSINQQSSPIEASSTSSSLSSNSNLTLNENDNNNTASNTNSNHPNDPLCNNNSNSNYSNEQTSPPPPPPRPGTDLSTSMYNQSFLAGRNEDPDSAASTSVRVAVRIRPVSTREQIDLCKVCTNVTPNEPQVTLGSKDDKSFTYDYVFDRNETQERIFEECVRSLVDGCLDGYNATVLAYGQTGSGKTYSMGTSFDESLQPEEEGIIPRAIIYLFNRIDSLRRQCMMTGVPVPTFTITAQFMELYNEDINDLFSHLPAGGAAAAVDGFESLQITNGEFAANSGRPSAGASFGKSKIEIHEDQNGAINLSNISTREVRSATEVSFLFNYILLSKMIIQPFFFL
jgi:hypothetical protein